MGKQANKSEKVVKKGCVISRRNNRTINQDVSKRDGAWENVGHGILQKKGPGNKTAYITLKGGKFVSLTRKQVDIALAPKDAPEEQKAA